jgi:hypothetical protein
MTYALYRDHPIRAQLAQILDMQGREEFTDPSVAENEPVAFARDKVFGLARLIASLLDMVPATLASSVAISNMQAHLQQPVSELSNFLANRNPGHIANAAAQFDQNVMPLLWGLPQQINSLGGEESLSAIVARQAQASADAVQQLNAQRAELESRFAAVQAQADSLTGQLQSLADAAARERAEAAATVANLQKEFADREIERAKNFETAADKQRRENKLAIDKLGSEVKKLFDDHK